ncbi:hypothetical protein DYB36_003273 [Aphanomyces astaci]|uniref:RNase NYN domain-containing protein n=1 Tax=Aphanomyces astaci TaxID=112090 RepID=A0A397A1H6_APHAT|nr:hypothetical protein DYB36_003273 [Aphanomyces astaci]
MATVVLDAANVATVSSGILRVQRLEAALEYFQRLNVRCIAFAPRYWVDGLQVFEDDATKATLRALVDTDKLVLTPPQAHDDYYVIDYATKHDGYVVSNDMFRDHVMHKVHIIPVSLSCTLSNVEVAPLQWAHADNRMGKD